MIYTLECICNACGIEYEIRYDDGNFNEPTHCGGCGSDGSLETNVKTVE
jgi:hypothetical protein